MKTIAIISPVNNKAIINESDLICLKKANDISFKIYYPDNDLQEIISAEDEIIATRSIVDTVIKAEKEGANGVIIFCFGEPGVEESKKIVGIPVVGIAYPSMWLANNQEGFFIVISAVEAHNPLIDQLALRFGFLSKMRPACAVDMSPVEISHDPDLFLERSLDIIKNNNMTSQVHAYILGCGSMAKMTEQIKVEAKET